jgi:hypothetical protein
MGPEEAEVVRTIFTCYLERGSMGALLTELDRQGIRTKLRSCSRTGSTSARSSIERPACGTAPGTAQRR